MCELYIFSKHTYTLSITIITTMNDSCYLEKSVYIVVVVVLFFRCVVCFLVRFTRKSFFCAHLVLASICKPYRVPL